MKFILLLFVPCVFAYPDWFSEYVKKHNKVYNDTHDTFKFLQSKMDVIRRTTDLNLTFNDFSDKEIVRNKYITRKKIVQFNHHTKHHLGLPLSFDWRTKGYVTPVVKQGSCGGCFSIAAMGNLEYWYKKMTGKLVPLSIQQGLDCTEGCKGGLMEDIYEYAQKHPIGPESWNPFTKHKHKCMRRTHKPYIKVNNYMVISDEYNMHAEEKLAHNILSYGPIPVGIDSSSHEMELYESGIIKEHHCGKDIDHAVLVVGFTRDYWIIKNSWGKKWGEDGYFRLERFKNACGIDSYASFATEVSV